jgi:hypothetical protein
MAAGVAGTTEHANQEVHMGCQSKVFGTDHDGRTVFRALVSLTCLTCRQTIPVEGFFIRRAGSAPGAKQRRWHAVCRECGPIVEPVYPARPKAGLHASYEDCPACHTRYQRRQGQIPAADFRVVRIQRHVRKGRTAKGYLYETVLPAGTAVCPHCIPVPLEVETFEAWVSLAPEARPVVAAVHYQGHPVRSRTDRRRGEIRQG